MLEVLNPDSREARNDRSGAGEGTHRPAGGWFPELVPEPDIVLPAWLPVAAPLQEPRTRRVILVADEMDGAVCFVEAFRGLGADVSVVAAGDRSALALLLNRGDADRLVAMPAAPAGPTPDRRRTRSHLRTVLDLIEAAAECPGPAKPLVYVVTRGACDAVTGDAINLEHAPLNGLAATASLEQADAWGGQIDLDLSAHPSHAGLVAREVIDPPSETLVAYRAGRKLVQRLVHGTPPPHQTPPVFRADGWYLVTGGLGAVGLRVAEWLGAVGCRQIALLGRTGAAAPVNAQGAEHRLQQLQELGAEVRIFAADVADGEALGRVIADLEKCGSPLRGVFHAAGVVERRELVRTDESLIEEVLRPKLEGTWLLHELTAGKPLDWFVTFSSISAVWGAEGIGAYAAANAFLDGMAAYRRNLGLPGVSVNWGPWGGGGMATSGMLEALGRVGILGLEPHNACAALARVLAGGYARAVVARADWGRFRAAYGHRNNRRLLDHLTAKGTGPDLPPQPPGRGGLSSSAPREPEVVEALKAYLAKGLSVEGSETIDPDWPLVEVGVDSMTAADVSCWLEAKYRIRLSPGLLGSGATINSIARQIAALAAPAATDSRSALPLLLTRPSEVRTSGVRNCFAIEVYRSGAFRESSRLVATLRAYPVNPIRL